MVQEQPNRVERRLSAIVAADVAGYSRLMGLDEAGTARILREHRVIADALIAKHGGRIVKTTGDGILLEFPSVVDAVECSVAMQTVMAERNDSVPEDRRMLFRIGINLGDILIQGDDILGDGVNIAARLEGIAKAGGICISSSAYEQVRGKVAVEFTDLGEQSLKNIARPVRAYAVVPDGPGPGAQAGATPSPLSTPRLSIVVLPFANIGGDPEQEYFVDGVTESLTTDLSRMIGSFVIGRNTAFTYKGKHVDLKRVGQELGVRYVLEGSVQRNGNRMRVNVQLIDGETGIHLWAERFDKPVADLFDMQDEVVARLANQLGTELVTAEARRAERAPHPNSMDLYFQGMAVANRGFTPENLSQARSLFERALSLDHRNIEAFVGTAYVDVMRSIDFQTDDKPVRLAAAEATLAKVLSMIPNHAMAHCLFGVLQIFSNRAIQGIAECEQALELDRNLAQAHGWIGLAKCFSGRAEETEVHVLKALRLSPRDSKAFNWMAQLGVAKSYLGDDDAAVGSFRRSIESNRNAPPFVHFYLAAALAHLGRRDEARAAVQAGLALIPAFTIARVRAGAATDNPTYLSQRERIYEGMRMAGVPEG
jgi:TolB-like protein/class 3 adenylate cyclase/tetratricopeptide (TPR) repeat protein